MPLTDTEKRELGRFRDRVRETLGEPRTEVRLFGSKARGDDGPYSDLDVLVIVSGGDWRLRDKVSALAMDSLLESGVLISPKTLTRRQIRQLKHDGSPFIRNAEQDWIRI